MRNPVTCSNKYWCLNCKKRFNRSVFDLRPRICDDCDEELKEKVQKKETDGNKPTD